MATISMLITNFKKEIRMKNSSKIKMAAFTAFLTVVGGNSLEAATLEDRLDTMEKEISTLKEHNEVLTEELTSMENEKWYAGVDVSKSQSGMGAAASKVYYSENPLSIGGYGEFYYSDRNGVKNASGGENSAITDTYRFVPYIGYKFSDKIILNSEIEFEHGGGEVAVEFLYLDFLLSIYANLRIGQQLVPMGLINLRHEPTLFPTVLRPDVETYIIPSTWNEMGVSVYGSTEDFAYQAGIINALNANNLDTVANGNKWLRNARNGSAEKTAMNKVGVIARFDYTGINGAKIGGSIYYGDASNVKTGNVSGTSLLMYELHGSYKKSGLFVNALYTGVTLSGAEKIAPNAPKESDGFYVNAGYNFFKPFHVEAPLFVQYEQYNLANKTANGTGEKKDVKNTTVGINFFPHEQVVLKMEYKIIDDKNIQEAKMNVVSLGVGFLF